MTQTTHKRFYLLLVVLLALIGVRYALQVDIPRAAFLIFIALICLLGDRDEIIAMCICCIPLHESIDFFYGLVLCIVIYVVKCHRHIRLNMGLILVLAMILWELLHCMRSDFSLMGFITNIVPLAVLAVMMCSELGDLDYGFVVRALTVSTTGVCITLFAKVLYLADFNIPLAVAGLQRLGKDTLEASQSVTVIGGELNPNTLGIICVLTTTGLMQLRTCGLGKKQDLVVACAIMVFGALTASRTYLVCLALMVVLLLFGQKGDFSRKVRFLVLIAAVLCMALAALWLFFPELLAYYISRFFVRDITTGRTELMSIYHRFIVSDARVLFFGIGLQDFVQHLTGTLMVADTVPHNAIQELIIAWGLPGLIFFGGLVITMIGRSRQFCLRPGLLQFIPLIIILVKSQAGQMLNSAYTMLTFSYAYLSLCMDLRPIAEYRILLRSDKRGAGENIKQSRRNKNK